MRTILELPQEPAAAFTQLLDELALVLARRGIRLESGAGGRVLQGAGAEPMASRLQFFDDAALEGIGRAAGFGEVRVERRALLEHARAAGVPDEALPLFAGPGAPFLIARNV